MRRRRQSLGAVRAERLHMAEFVIGRDVGHPVGKTFERAGRSCTTGGAIAGRTVKGPEGQEMIPFKVAREEFVNLRIEQVGDKAGATLLPGWGAWMGGRERSYVGQIMWMPGAESTPRAFHDNMLKLCERAACMFSQREVLMRLTRPRGPLLLRCTPPGARQDPWAEQ